MKNIKVLLIAVLAIAVLITGMALIGKSDAAGLSTQPPSGSPGIQLETGVISQVTTTTAGIFKITVPWPTRVLGFSIANSAQTGSTTYDLTNGTTSLLTSVVTGSTVVSAGTLTTTGSLVNIAAGGTLQINTAGTGTANNVTYQIDLKRN